VTGPDRTAFSRMSSAPARSTRRRSCGRNIAVTDSRASSTSDVLATGSPGNRSTGRVIQAAPLTPWPRERLGGRNPAQRLMVARRRAIRPPRTDASSPGGMEGSYLAGGGLVEVCPPETP